MKNILSKYHIGIMWFILSLMCSVTNDTISRYANFEMHSLQVSFLRFFFSIVTLIPVVMFNGIKSLKSSSVVVHIIRGFLLFVGILAWTYGLKYVLVPTATVISFSITIFTLILGVIFLKEKVIWQRWIASIIGFIGVIVTLYPQLSGFNNHGFLFLGAAVAFASLDVINKIFMVKETVVGMMFYSSLVTCILSLFPAIYYWKPISSELWIVFLVFGMSANLILYFILKAFSLVDATATAPYRYLELILSSIASYLCFNEIPPQATIYGAMIIIPSTMFIIYSESKKR